MSLTGKVDGGRVVPKNYGFGTVSTIRACRVNFSRGPVEDLPHPIRVVHESQASYNVEVTLRGFSEGGQMVIRCYGTPLKPIYGTILIGVR